MPRSRQPRRGYALVDLAEIREPGSKTDGVDAVLLLLVDFDNLLDTQASTLGDALEVGTRFDAVVDRQRDEFARARVDVIEVGKRSA